ncbi:dopamine receptor 3-like [Apis laboriosa]|uniref:dopamine receptor 3-like n=1 Tax=Apis laboriosa TaxID=183418 RepID=UPI001CC4C420|nr:dopamine receptor 3-like [Apis laboriosa]
MEYWMASNETGHNGREETIQEVLRDPGSAVLFVGYPRWLLQFAAGCCILFMLIGIPGNLFTIVALFRTKKVRKRSTSTRNQDEELSILSSNCTTNVLCPNFSSKCAVTSFNQLNYSRSPSRSAIEESLWDQPSWEQNSCGIEKDRKISEYDEEKVQQIIEAERWKKDSEEQVNQFDNDASIKTIVEICDKSKPGLVIKIDDIPYVDDLEAMETVFSNDCIKIKESTEKNSTNSGNKIERTTSRASFLIESSLWMQRLNSKTSTDSDRYDDSKSNTPDRSTKKKSIIIRRESRFKSVRKFRNPDGSPRMSNKDKKLLKMILVIFSSFLVCYLPITVTKIFKDSIDWRGLNIAGYILIYLTTCINPVVYVVMSSEYRSAYKNVLLCKNEFGANHATKKSPR